MIIVSVILMSAIDGSSTELARMGIDNASGGGRVRDYNTRTWRGRDTDALNRAMVADTVTRKGKVEGHPSLDLHVWHLVAKALAGMGYGDGPPMNDLDTRLDYERRILAAEVEGVRAEKAMRELAATAAETQPNVASDDASWAQGFSASRRYIAEAIRALPLELGRDPVDADSTAAQ